jgi:GR25 family glycosyltransferase involved in LPS biosynthesis
MKYYVIHHPKLTDRREFLESQFIRFDIKDVQWVTHLNADDLFIHWIKQFTDSPLPTGHISCNIKHFWVLADMVKNQIQEAIILEDDVVFHNDFGKLVISEDYFLRLGIGVNFHMKPGLHLIPYNNGGGTEAQYVTISFAREMLKDISFVHSIDTIYFAHLIHRRVPTMCIPICHQTSIFESTSSTGSLTERNMNWLDVIKNWKSIKKFCWDELLQEYEKRLVVEDYFHKNFGKTIKIVNPEFIRTMHHYLKV